MTLNPKGTGYDGENKLRVALVTTMFYKLIATYRNLYNVAEFWRFTFIP